MEATIYNQDGKSAGTIALPEAVFGAHWNSNLVYQVKTAMETHARNAIAHTKTRGEVRGGGKKPWKQKGTGRARHGSTRSPIWVGGGVAHGPRNDKNFDRKINRKMKAKALFVILSKKWKDGEVLFVDKFAMPVPKATEGKKALMSLAGVKGFEILFKKWNNSAYIALGTKDMAVEKSFRNFGNVIVSEARNMNPVDLLNYKYVIITHPAESIAFLAGKMDKIPTKAAPVAKEFIKPMSKRGAANTAAHNGSTVKGAKSAKAKATKLAAAKTGTRTDAAPAKAKAPVKAAAKAKAKTAKA